MAAEQKKTSSDEEIDKILAELGVLSVKPSSAGNKTVVSEPETSREAPVSVTPKADSTASSDDFRIDAGVFDDIKRGEQDAASVPQKPQKTAEPSRPVGPRSKAVQTKRRPEENGMSAGRKSAGSSKPQGLSRHSASDEHGLNVPHRESHLKDELEKMAVSSSSQTGQLTRQLRAGKKLEEITASIPAQQRRQPSRRPSERVQKAAEFAASVAAEKPQKKSIGKTVAGWIAAIVSVVAILVVVFGFLLPVVSVEGSSMSPTLEQGDKLLISGVLYTPKAGDIVVVSDNNALKKQLVKRIIATAGQTVEIKDDGTVLVDGTAIDESYLAEPNEPAGDTVYPVTVGEGEVFVMGDNRAHSLDSRDGAIGMIETSDIRGKVLLRFYPFGSFGGVD